ncbi:MAG TPA: Ig-like domain-containing protein [Actinomycetota bacterium]|nr:Ig-like domain-containing protein [Actinomycetota bacterium]
MTKILSTSLAATVLAATLVLAAAPVSAQEAPGVLAADRETEAVVLTGAQVPTWSTAAAVGVGPGHADGAFTGERSAHNEVALTDPPDARDATAADPDQITAYRYEGDRFVEIPVQVDERYPYFLANPNSDFGIYSGTDEELSYAWDVESWAKTAGQCNAEYPEGVSARPDPTPQLDDDDEIAFMASDAGAQAPLEAKGPIGSGTERQEIRLVDPLDPTSTRFVYLFKKLDGSTFTADNGYVDYQRDANADEYIDQNSFTDDSFEKLGSSNTGYGPNLSGTVCNDNLRTPAVETIRDSNDRFPRDGITVTTDAYKFRATGRWMIRGMQVAKPDGSGYGDDLIDRWKGRAFQQSPDSSVSVVGFEDEQVNWEGNSALLGELRGPVRAIREVWGADSGTNVTKTETFYRDAIQYRYRVRVHPIPPDGLYTSWDYNARVADTYYNELKTDGVAIDGQNDDVGQIDEVPVSGQPAFFDVNDPTFNKPLSFLNWEQVSGKDDNGSLVYMFQMNNPQSLENPLVVPYYRDDACLDDGTGDDPSPRPWPGEAQSNERLAEYMQRPCYGDPANNTADNTYSKDSATGFRQGCFACHGIHYFVTGDTDNTFSPAKTTEIDGSQWQWAAPTAQPTNVGDRYANTVKVPLVPIVSYYPMSVANDVTPTTIEITGDTHGQVSDVTTLAARLSDTSGPMEGRELVFAIGGEEVGRAITNESGEASVQTTLAPPARESQQTVSFSGEDDYSVSSNTSPYQIELDDSALAFTLTLAKQGKASSATATLTDADSGAGLSGRTIHFFVQGDEVATAVTDASGVAKASFPMKKRSSATASFQGDDSYKASSST